jgi:hypothetical protein
VTRKRSRSLQGIPDSGNRILHVAAWTALLAVPFTLGVQLDRPGETIFLRELPATDPVLWLAFGAVVVVDRLRRGGAGLRSFLSRVPAESWLLIAVAALGLLFSARPAEGIPDLVQVLDTFVLGLALIGGLRFGPSFRFLGIALTILLAIMAAAAAMQVWSGTDSDFVRSFFRNRQSFLAAQVVLAPLAVSLLPRSRLSLLGGSLILGVCAAFTGSMAVALLILLAMAAVARIDRRHPIYPASFALSIGMTVAFLLPDSHRSEFLAGPAGLVEAPMGAVRAEVLRAKVALEPRPPVTSFPLGHHRVFVSHSFDAWLEPTPMDSIPAEMDEAATVVQEFYPLSWSALTTIGRSPPLGNGLGSWGRVAPTSMGAMERTGTSYPGTENGYLHLGLTMGTAGLIAWFALVLRALHDARALLADPSTRALGAGALAASVSGCLWMLACPLPILPIGLYWTLPLALTVRHGARKP